MNFPPCQLGCLGPEKSLLRQSVWHDFEQKNLPLFEHRRSFGVRHISFPQTEQVRNLPVRDLIRWQGIEQYFPQPRFKKLGFT